MLASSLCVNDDDVRGSRRAPAAGQQKAAELCSAWTRGAPVLTLAVCLHTPCRSPMLHGREYARGGAAQKGNAGRGDAPLHRSINCSSLLLRLSGRVRWDRLVRRPRCHMRNIRMCVTCPRSGVGQTEPAWVEQKARCPIQSTSDFFVGGLSGDECDLGLVMAA